MARGKGAPGRSGPCALVCAGALVGIALCGMYSYAFCCSLAAGIAGGAAVLPTAVQSAEASVVPSPFPGGSGDSGNDNDSLIAYMNTIRSCLGGAGYCFDEKVSSVRKGGAMVDRIGLLAVPRSGEAFVEAVFNSLVTSTAASAGKGDPNSNIELVVSSNVPAYGYGKNHGWTRIIRLTRGLLPHAFTLLQSNSSSGQGIPTDIAFSTQVRQIVRWNCRLSHVAAHTKMLTVFAEDIALRPLFELEKMLTFAGVRYARADLQRLLAAGLHSLRADLAPDRGSSSGTGAALYRCGLAALAEELTSSKNLTKWPCASFSELDRLAAAAGEQLPLRAEQLAPACKGDPHVKCSVPIDQRGG